MPDLVGSRSDKVLFGFRGLRFQGIQPVCSAIRMIPA